MSKQHLCKVCNDGFCGGYECPYKHTGVCTCNGSPFALCDRHIEEYEAEKSKHTEQFGVCHYLMQAIKEDMMDEKVILT